MRSVRSESSHGSAKSQDVQEYSRRLMDFLKTYTPEIEQVSVDECYMDFTGIAQRFSSPVRLRMKSKPGFMKSLGLP